MSLNDEIKRNAEWAREIVRGLESSRLAAKRIKEMMKINQQHRQHMIDQAAAVSRMIDRTHTHRTWLRNIKSTQDQAAQLQITVNSTLAPIADRLAVSDRLLTSIDVDAIRRSIALPELEIPRLQESVIDMTTIYRKMAEAIRTYPDITDLPQFALPGATREVFVTGYAVNALGISDEADAEQDSSELRLVAEIEEETSICITLLETVDADLARPYVGARDALRGTNPDRTRHFLSSLRELWSHLLRQIAPDKRVLEWIPKDDEELLHEGRPTRRSRILYLCRDLNHGPLTNFIADDADIFVKFIEFFSRVHELNTELSYRQLRGIQLRSDSWLTYILQIWRESR